MSSYFNFLSSIFLTSLWPSLRIRRGVPDPAYYQIWHIMPLHEVSIQQPLLPRRGRLGCRDVHRQVGREPLQWARAFSATALTHRPAQVPMHQTYFIGHQWSQLACSSGCAVDAHPSQFHPLGLWPCPMSWPPSTPPPSAFTFSVMGSLTKPVSQ